MVVLGKQKRVSLNGNQANSANMPNKESVIAKVVSLLRKQPRIQHVLKIPLNKPIGRVMYTVESTIEPVTFYKRKDAECFKRLLNKAATHEHKADIIRREITDEGYIPTYPGERK